MAEPCPTDQPCPSLDDDQPNVICQPGQGDNGQDGAPSPPASLRLVLSQPLTSTPPDRDPSEEEVRQPSNQAP